MSSPIRRCRGEHRFYTFIDADGAPGISTSRPRAQLIAQRFEGTFSPNPNERKTGVGCRWIELDHRRVNDPISAEFRRHSWRGISAEIAVDAVTAPCLHALGEQVCGTPRWPRSTGRAHWQSHRTWRDASYRISDIPPDFVMSACIATTSAALAEVTAEAKAESSHRASQHRAHSTASSAVDLSSSLIPPDRCWSLRRAVS